MRTCNSIETSKPGAGLIPRYMTATSRKITIIVVLGLIALVSIILATTIGRAQEAETEKPKTTSQRQGLRRQEALPSTEQILKMAPSGVKVIPDIAYREGNEAWKLDLAMPEARGKETRPGIVFVHGGGWRGGDKRRGNFLRGALEYAARGYVCITVNYRLTDEAPFPACVEDVKCAVRWFRAHAEEYHLDPDRIGGFGNSAGAHLVAMLGLTGPDAKLEGDGPHPDQPSLLQAVCCAATPTNFPNWPNGVQWFGRPGGLLAGDRKSLAARAKKASPITYVEADAPPFLVVHGSADRTVDVSQGDAFVEALKKAGADDVTYIRIDAAGHGVFIQHTEKTGPAMEAFFARTLR